MFSEYLLGDNFESGRDAGYSRSGGPDDGGGCLVMFAVLGSLLTGGFLGLVFAMICIALF